MIMMLPSEKEKNNNTENEKEQKKEYELYLNSKEIFTILALIGCKVLNTIEEENIFKDLKDKFISENYLSKKDFFEYNFWFEKFFDYQKFKKPSDESDLKFIEKDIEMNIKDFLFELWKDENNNIDLKKMLEVLKMNNYITDFIEYNNKKYFDVIFLE